MKNRALNRQVRTVASNPVAKAVERARLRKWAESVIAMAEEMPEGQECGSILSESIELVLMALKAMEGWDDPECIGDAMVEGVQAAERMVIAGSKWNPAEFDVFADAVHFAVQIISGVTPTERVNAALWAGAIKSLAAASQMEAA